MEHYCTQKQRFNNKLLPSSSGKATISGSSLGSCPLTGGVGRDENEEGAVGVEGLHKKSTMLMKSIDSFFGKY